MAMQYVKVFGALGFILGYLIFSAYYWLKEKKFRRAMKRWTDFEKQLKFDNPMVRRNRDPYPFHRPGWHGQAQGHRPAPAVPTRAPLGFWRVLGWMVFTCLGMTGVIWLSLQWLQVLSIMLGFSQP
jgi:hypothetical protein